MMSQNYEYPLDYSWSYQEMQDVITLWNAVEKAYEQSVSTDEFLEAYKKFKAVVPSKGEEKQLAKQFEDRSGYVLYTVWKLAQTDVKKIKIEK